MKQRETKIAILDKAGINRNANIIIGDSNKYVSGDLLDANATWDSLDGLSTINNQKLTSGGNISVADGTAVSQLQQDVAAIQALIEADEDGAIDKFNEIVAFLAGISDDDILYNIIHRHIDNGVTQAVSHEEVMTQAAYDLLETKAANTIYNIVDE